MLIIYFVDNLDGYMGQRVGRKRVKDDPRLLGLNTRKNWLSLSEMRRTMGDEVGADQESYFEHVKFEITTGYS